MTTTGSMPENVFTVDLGDLVLSRDAADRIARSVQKAVLLEIATLDLSPGFTTNLVRPEGLKGPTYGIWIKQDQSRL